jgi:AraC family transcriptional activator of pobA
VVTSASGDAVRRISRAGRHLVESGHVNEVRQLTYQPPGGGNAAVEVMSFDRLRQLDDGQTQRADFHVLALVDSGAGSVTVDFVQHPTTRRSVVWIAPGAVHRWDAITDVVGHLVLFVPTAPVTPATRALLALPVLARWQIPDEDWALVDIARTHLVAEAAAAGPPPTELPQILLSALLARLRPPSDRPNVPSSTFELFRTSVEAHFRTHHDVGWYARSLGYAPRTLTRAALAATGQTAKAYLVDRIVLEARRLLAHDRCTAGRCARELGFSDASSFSLFFRTATGVRPGAWQQAWAAR